MRSRLVGALAAIALVAAMWLDVGVARADTMPIHRGLPNDGYGEPDVGGTNIGLRPLLVFSLQVSLTRWGIFVPPHASPLSKSAPQRSHVRWEWK